MKILLDWVPYADLTLLSNPLIAGHDILLHQSYTILEASHIVLLIIHALIILIFATLMSRGFTTLRGSG